MRIINRQPFSTRKSQAIQYWREKKSNNARYLLISKCPESCARIQKPKMRKMTRNWANKHGVRLCPAYLPVFRCKQFIVWRLTYSQVVVHLPDYWCCRFFPLLSLISFAFVAVFNLSNNIFMHFIYGQRSFCVCYGRTREGNREGRIRFPFQRASWWRARMHNNQ